MSMFVFPPVTISTAGLATETTAASIDSTLTTLETKTASSDVTEVYDYRRFAYVGATTKIDTITYKTGGAGGTTVALQTFEYDGSDRLTSITKS